MTMRSHLSPLLPWALTALTLAAGPAWAQKLLPAQSEIQFTTRQMGVPVEGAFKKFLAELAFDPKKPEAGKIRFAIDTGSASFGIADTDAELPKAPWFNVPRFPQAVFTASSIKAVGPARFEAAGRLSLKGATRDVTVPFALAKAGANTVATGTFTVKRLDFSIGEGDWADPSVVANDVLVKFKFTLADLTAF